MKRLGLFVFVCIAALTASAQKANYNIIPLPKEVKADITQQFVLKSGMGIAYDSSNTEIVRTAEFLQQWVKEATGIQLQLTPEDKTAQIKLVVSAPAKKGKKAKQAAPVTEQQKEAYTLSVGAKGILLSATEPVGLFRAAQTLRKSLPITKDSKGVEMPFVQITDQPRFSYRGVLLDCGRHFFSVEFIKQFLDAMALHGCNQFHWHLTEDQGWRFEVKAYPELAKKGSLREKTVIGPGNMRIYCQNIHVNQWF